MIEKMIKDKSFSQSRIRICYKIKIKPFVLACSLLLYFLDSSSYFASVGNNTFSCSMFSRQILILKYRITILNIKFAAIFLWINWTNFKKKNNVELNKFLLHWFFRLMGSFGRFLQALKVLLFLLSVICFNIQDAIQIMQFACMFNIYTF